MKHQNKLRLTLLAWLLIASVNSYSQGIEQMDSPDSKLILAAKDILSAANTCTLITLDREGRPRARIMDPFLPEDDMTVWFGTNRQSRKVDQIKNDPRVTLFYQTTDGSGYVMIHGKAELIDDPLEKEKRWKDGWEAFYPDKSKGYLLIRVSPLWMEVVSYAHGILGDPETWEPPAVYFTSE